MKYYVVLDTNVLVSAMLKTGSAPGQVMAEALNGDIIPVLNDEIITEYEDVLNRPKFRFDKKAVNMKHFPVQTYIVTPREMFDIVENGR